MHCNSHIAHTSQTNVYAKSIMLVCMHVHSALAYYTQAPNYSQYIETKLQHAIMQIFIEPYIHTQVCIRVHTHVVNKYKQMYSQHTALCCSTAKLKMILFIKPSSVNTIKRLIIVNSTLIHISIWVYLYY